MHGRALHQRYGRGRGLGKNPQHAFKALRKLSADKQAVWEAYHAGKITSAEMSRRSASIEKRRQNVRDASRARFYKDGDIVESKWGERARITGIYTDESGHIGIAGYRIVRGLERGEEIHDMWPSEVIVRRVSRAA